jgi:aminodeoxyfutalosine synthase
VIAPRQWLDADILTLGMAADEARRALGDAVVTYVRVHTLTAGELARATTVPEAASEVRLYETPDTLDEAVAVVHALKGVAGPRRVVAFSMADLETRAREGWGDLRHVLRRLAAAGLSDVAELPVDRLDDLTESVQSLADTGVRPQRITVSQPVGSRKLELIDRVRAASGRHPWILRFAPLPRVAPIDKPTTGYDDVRMIALSRLTLSETRGPAGRLSIEVDWTLYGPKLAQVALTFGADHLDAVAATSDETLGPRRRTVEDVERNIRAAGFEPREHRPPA